MQRRKIPMANQASRLRFRFSVCAAALLALGLLSGCAVHHHHDDRHVRVVKAPREPRHGYTRHHHGVVLVFDGTWAGYRVRGRSHHYFHRDVYYRRHGGRWYRARRPGGPWSWTRARSLPRSLAAHHERIERREVRRERREDRREARWDYREDRRDARRERREDRRDTRRDRREDRQDARQDRGEDRQEARQDRREDRRDTRQEQREKRRAKKKSKDSERDSASANRADDE